MNIVCNTFKESPTDFDQAQSQGHPSYAALSISVMNAVPYPIIPFFLAATGISWRTTADLKS